MTIPPISQISVKQYLNTSNTGYMSLAGIGLSAITASVSPLKKLHKPTAIVTAALALVHFGTTLNHNNHNQKNVN